MTRAAWLPGLAVALAAAGAGYIVHLVVPVVPWLTVALVLGVITGCVPRARVALDGALRPGLAVASRRPLRVGIVLLGLKLSLEAIAALGWVAILGIVVLVLLSFGLTWLVAKAFRLGGDQPLLLAAGFSICGVSAVGAMAAARGSSEKDTGPPIALVTLLGTAAIVVLPALAPLLGLDAVDFGRWTGASVHDVGQVVATAQVAGAAALAAAVVIKLTRVLMLAPIVAVAALTAPARQDGTKRPPIVPLFIVGFIAMVLVRSVLPVPEAVLAIADLLQSVLLAAALFAIGASLRLETLARSGARTVGAGVVSWLLILGLALALVHLS
ncbi:putative sulfate exporter family transporter [Glaciihabitans arcticus]|uniref:Putative sulfate exporter family transporter n=1 Tax=Glaciihabitans arcticus TaxID=2668039 RepID=A0A4Q9GMQ1_9MICO|nr:putative sulfate exporter family transporter [Glaciihabitans arcticus]TBN56062.1 putative sulfate exporter family transporter [Glaciihabitans arcticus]